MNNILVVGAGGVSHVTVHKMAQNPNYFKNIITHINYYKLTSTTILPKVLFSSIFLAT